MGLGTDKSQKSERRDRGFTEQYPSMGRVYGLYTTFMGERKGRRALLGKQTEFCKDKWALKRTDGRGDLSAQPGAIMSLLIL